MQDKKSKRQTLQVKKSITNLVQKARPEQGGEKSMAKFTYEDISEVKSIGSGHTMIRYIAQKQPTLNNKGNDSFNNFDM